MSKSPSKNEELIRQLQRHHYAKKLSLPRRPHPGSAWRICSRGTVRAGRLPALHVQGWHSTKDALAAWLELGTAAALNDSRSKVVIDEELRAAGLLDGSPSAASDEELHDGSPQSNNP